MKLQLTLLSLFAAVGATFCDPVASQCPTLWGSGAQPPGLIGEGRCSTLWDPDGGGPLPQRLVVGGLMYGATATEARGVMTWDGTQWQALPPIPDAAADGEVSSITTWNGLLVAGGYFSGGGMEQIAVWNGTSWQALGPGLTFVPTALTSWNGNLVACGYSASGPISSAVVSVWNGSSWSMIPLPSGVWTGVEAAVSFQGLLCVALDNFVSLSGMVAAWNGSSWVQAASTNGRICCLALRPSSILPHLYVAGEFTSINGVAASHVARTSGGTGSWLWEELGGGVPADAMAMHVRSTSTLGAAVMIVTNSTPSVWQWNGSSFGSSAGNISAVESLAYYGGSYYAMVADSTNMACRRYDGSAWQAVAGTGIEGAVLALAPSGDDMIVGGSFLSTTSSQAHRIARWNGTTFAPLGTGIVGLSVDALARLGTGDIVAGGVFTSAGGNAAGNIARWDGSNWSPLGTGCDQQVLALAQLPNGDIVAGGRFTTAGGVACSRIARWNGTTWSPLGLGLNGDVHALAVRSDGRLFAGGAFTAAGTVGCSHVAQWNGTTWSPLGFGLNGDVHALAVRPNDEVVATGEFTTVLGIVNDRCARWNGSTWLPMGASSADARPTRALCTLPNGDVVVGRDFHPPSTDPDAGIARWSNFVWSSFGSGLASLPAGAPVSVRAMAQRADGVLVVGGIFGVAGGLAASGLATLTSSCPAQAVAFGSGCSAAGPLVQTAESLPWLGAPFRTATTGLQPASACFTAIGFTQVSIPLSSLLPQGQPGCTLLVSPDIVGLVAADAAGTVRSAVAVPNHVALLGAVFHQQTVPVEADGAGALAAVRAANALTATIGLF
ncbi:MAG: hypothetical protein AB7O97_14240 [Planctomycetota bacterium]